MTKSFITAFIIYFVVIDPVGNVPIFLTVTGAQDRGCKMRTVLEGTLVTTMIMLFFALCGAWVLVNLNISKADFKIVGGVILFLVALHMLAPNCQAHKRAASTGNAVQDSDTTSDGKMDSAGSHDQDGDHDNVAIYPLTIPLLAGPSAIMSAVVVTADFASSLGTIVTGYAALIAVMVAIGMILCATVVANTWVDDRISMVFSRITAIILAGLSVQYVIDGLTITGFASL